MYFCRVLTDIIFDFFLTHSNKQLKEYIQYYKIIISIYLFKKKLLKEIVFH